MFLIGTEFKSYCLIHGNNVSGTKILKSLSSVSYLNHNNINSRYCVIQLKRKKIAVGTYYYYAKFEIIKTYD